MVGGVLGALLRLEHDIEIVAEVARGDEVLPTALKAQPDVALLDVEMPGGGGLAAAEALHQRLPACRGVIVTTFSLGAYLPQALESGTLGFLLKDAPASQLPPPTRR